VPKASAEPAKPAMTKKSRQLLVMPSDGEVCWISAVIGHFL
jgi:hypothetical protein